MQNNNRRIRKGKPISSLPECALDYARARVDPWSAPPACFPGVDSTLSFKTKFILRGTVSIGTLGWGSIVCSRRNFSGSDTVLYTDATYAGSDIVTSGDVGAVAAPLPTPFISGSCRYRTVAQGLRICYTGTELNRSGTIYAVAGIGDGGYRIDGATAANLGANESVTICYPDSKRSWCGILPRIPTSSRVWTDVSTASYNVDYTAGFLIKGVAGETYQYEYVVHVEYGNDDRFVPVVTGLTPTYSASTIAAQIDSVVHATGGVVENAGTKIASFLKKAEGAAANAMQVIDSFGNIAGTTMKVVGPAITYLRPAMALL